MLVPCVFLPASWCRPALSLSWPSSSSFIFTLVAELSLICSSSSSSLQSLFLEPSLFPVFGFILSLLWAFSPKSFPWLAPSKGKLLEKGQCGGGEFSLCVSPFSSWLGCGAEPRVLGGRGCWGQLGAGGLVGSPARVPLDQSVQPPAPAVVREGGAVCKQ